MSDQDRKPEPEIEEPGKERPIGDEQDPQSPASKKPKIEEPGPEPRKQKLPEDPDQKRRH